MRTSTNDVNPTETEGGQYVFSLTQAETNGDKLSFYPQSASANVLVIALPGVIYTRPPNFPSLGIENDGDLTKVNTLNGHTPQTGDSFARLGAPNGVSVSADIATVDGNVDTLVTRVPQTLNLTVSGNIGIDWANVENPTTPVDLSQTDIQLCDTVTDVTNGVTVATNNDKTGYALTSGERDQIWSVDVENGIFPAASAANILRSTHDDTDELQTDWKNGGRLDLLIDAILTDTGTTLPGLINGLNDISQAQVNAQVLDVIQTDPLIDGKSIQQAIRYIAASTAGQVSGAGTGTETFKGLDNTTNRLQITVGAGGNRTGITYDP